MKLTELTEGFVSSTEIYLDGSHHLIPHIAALLGVHANGERHAISPNLHATWHPHGSFTFHPAFTAAPSSAIEDETEVGSSASATFDGGYSGEPVGT